MRQRYVPAAISLALGIATFAYRYLSFEGFPNDHFVHLARAQQMLMGALPVRDYAEYQAPLAAAISALAQWLFGPGLRAELWVVCAAFAVATVVACALALLVSRSIAAAVGAGVVLMVATPVSYSYPKVLPYVLAFSAAWYYAVHPTWRSLALLAAAIVFAGLLRHDHAVVLGLGAAAALLARHGLSRSSAIEIGRLVGLGVLFALPYIAWVQAYEGVAAYISTNLDAGRTEAEKANWAPPGFEIDRSRPLFSPMAEIPTPVVNVRWREGLPEGERLAREAEHRLRPRQRIGPDTWQYELRAWSSSSLEQLVRDPAAADTQGIDRTAFALADPPPLTARILQYVRVPDEGARPFAVATLYYLSWTLPAIATLLLAWRWRELDPAVRTVVVMAIVVQLVMSRMMLRDPLVTRVRDVVAPLVVLLAFLSVALAGARAGFAGRVAARVAATVVFVIAAAAAAGAGGFAESFRETQAAQGWEGLQARTAELRDRYRPPRERIGELEWALADYVSACTEPDDRMFAMTFVSELFFYTGRGFAGGHDALHSRFYASDEQATRMLDRLAGEDVPLVIMDNETDAEAFRVYPRVGAWVKSRYHEIGRFPAGPGKEFIVLAENGRQPQGTFGEHGMPCFAAPPSTQVRSAS